MYIMITTTSDSREILQSISKKILKEKLSPCIQSSSNIESLYIWNKKFENSTEYKIEIKTHNKFQEKIVSIIKEKHNYSVPEIVSCNIELIDKDYRKWFNEVNES